MGNVYSVEGNRSLLLYPYEKRIYMRNLQGERAEKAILLSTDFLESLSDVLYGNTIYYSYINQQREIIVKNILEQKVVFSSSYQYGMEYFSPVLEVVGDRLLLICFMKNPFDRKYVIKVFFPLQGEEILLSGEYEEILQKKIGWIPETGIFYLKEKDGSIFWKMQWEEKTCRVQRLFWKEKVEWEKFITEMEKRNHVIQEKEAIIESIKIQYEELMQTASAYQKEAIKWREKYYKSKNGRFMEESEKNVK